MSSQSLSLVGKKERGEAFTILEVILSNTQEGITTEIVWLKFVGMCYCSTPVSISKSIKLTVSSHLCKQLVISFRKKKKKKNQPSSIMPEPLMKINYLQGTPLRWKCDLADRDERDYSFWCPPDDSEI